MTYWIYQHVGNLSPDEQDADGLLNRLQRLTDGTGIWLPPVLGPIVGAIFGAFAYDLFIGRAL